MHVHCSSPAQISYSDIGTEVHVYLPCRGAISFYIHIVPLSLISRFSLISRTFSHFKATITQKLLENQGNRNNVLYVVFY